MNRLLLMGLISSCLLILTGCHHKDNHEKTHTPVSQHTPVVISDPTDDKNDENNNPGNNDDPPVTCEVTPTSISKFTRVQLTYGLLDAGSFIATETGSTLPIEITAPAKAGDTVISVDSTVALVDQQLLTYLGTNGFYRVARIKSQTADTITLKMPLRFDLAVGNNSLWNFYDDKTHANNFGLRALADYAFGYVSDALQPNQVHVLLGDSWFKRNGNTAFADRLQERLPSGSIINNEGVGGDTLCDLLARVDEVINTHNPQYVWINSSINDYYDGVTQAQYKARMQTLIGKVQASGASAIVMDPAPGMLDESTADGRRFTLLSDRYATQILDLLAETSE